MVRFCAKLRTQIRGPWTLVLLGTMLCTYGCAAHSDDMDLVEAYIAETRAMCAQQVDAGEFKGEPTTGYSTSDDDFFVVTDGAVKTYRIGSVTRSQPLYIISVHEMLCAGTTMNGFCGSSGCEYTIIAGEQRYDMRGGEPQVVTAYGQTILLIAVYPKDCGASSIETLCLEAWTWDQRARGLVKILEK
jgi:hypothetical protein